MRKIEIATVRASTQYKQFGPDSLVDGDKEFGGWISDVGDWRNAWVEFRFEEPARVGAVEICNGFVEEAVNRARDDYFFHLRAADVAVSFAGAGGGEAILVRDVKEPQLFEIDSDAVVEAARITIRGVHRQAPSPEIKPFDVVGLRQMTWYAD